MINGLGIFFMKLQGVSWVLRLFIVRKKHSDRQPSSTRVQWIQMKLSKLKQVNVIH